MKRHSEALELLNAIRDNISDINKAYEEARHDEARENILRPKIKNCFEDLRSCLEYSAHDVWASYSQDVRKIYFPYGRTKELFINSVNKNLPSLPDRSPSVYRLIESMQPFADESDWLIELCRHTNFNKHEGLSDQVRVNSATSVTTFGKLAIIEGEGVVNFHNCIYNGLPISKSGPLTISSSLPVSEMAKNINIHVPLAREFDWVRFEIKGSLYDVLQLITLSHSKIKNYVTTLKSLIG